MSRHSREPGRWSRRRFLGTSAAAAGAASSAALLGSPRDAAAFSLAQVPEGLPPDQEVASVCELCFWNCGLVAQLRKGRPLALKGNPRHPNSRGKLCARGNAGIGAVRDEDRLKYPMVRVGERGEGRFERVGWPTAYRLIAQNFARIKEAHGPESLALFYHGSGGPMIRSMMVAYGSPNFAGPAYAQCKGPRNVGYKLTFGEKLPSPEPLDFENTRCMVFFGSHLGENAHNSQVQDFVRARARGAHLIVLDPRFSTPASKADVWLPVKPGSDAAVILAWIHLLIAEGAYHKDFVEHQTVGLEKLAEHVRPFTPEWAAEQAGVSVEGIRKAYELIKASAPAVLVHPGRHVSWYGEADTQRARAQAILTALLGAFWAPGGIHRWYSPSVPDFPGPDYPDLEPNVDVASKRFPFAQEVTTNGIRDATLTGRPYPIKGWFVHGTNLIQSLPNLHETVEAIQKLDFLVVCDILPTEITNYADVLLPEDTYLERYDDLFLGTGRVPFVALRQPVTKSPFDTRPAWRIAKELGTALGVGDFFGYSTFEEYLDFRLKGLGSSLEALKTEGVLYPKGDYPSYLDPSAEFHWHTPSGKVELFSEQLASAGFAGLPGFEALAAGPERHMRMLYGRSPVHTFGRTQNNAILNDLTPGNCVWLHPSCAKANAVVHGEWVMLRNPHGDETGPIRVRVSERIQPKTLYLVHGFGHSSKGLSRACCMGGNDTAILDTYQVCPISGCTGMRTQFVSLRHLEPGEKEFYPCVTA